MAATDVLDSAWSPTAHILPGPGQRQPKLSLFEKSQYESLKHYDAAGIGDMKFEI
jgi:hypothetical protein